MSGKVTNPTGKGGFKKGESGNPGGRTLDAIQAAEALNAWLRSDEISGVGKDAYRELLETRNPVITKDFMDRVAGKAKEVLEVSGKLDPFANVDPVRLLAALEKLGEE